MTPWGAVALLPLLALVAGCNKAETPTSATTPTTTTIADPTTSEVFTGAVPVGGASFFSFTVAENGTVDVTLTEVGGPSVPATVWMGLGLGTPSGEDCATTTAVNIQAAATPQLTGTYTPGIYCARVFDIGNLVAPAAFAVTIAHP
ncbi:MAG: hypothetical protein R2708_23875 [Vicinamibacterales bacterium]